MSQRVSPAARRLLAGIALVGVVAAAIAVGVIARSNRSIADLRATPFASTAPSGIQSAASQPAARARAAITGPGVRVVVIGGMAFTGFWNDLADRYEKQNGVHIDLVSSGEKNDIAHVFRGGGVDVITMHACDTMVNLVADGYAMDPQPWLRNDLVIVGPPDDPAKINGMTDAAAALKKIADAKVPFVVHASIGTQEVLANIIGPNQIAFDPAAAVSMFGLENRSVLQVAARKHAYTMVGRIPFRTGRLPNDGLVMIVSGDPRLRRPYLIAVANPARVPDAHLAEARRFAAWVREPATQAWVAGYGRGVADDQPLFFPGAPPAVSDAAGAGRP
jgi:tungstate transport system substrate-binding protein